MKKLYSGLASILGFVIIVLYALENAGSLVPENETVTMVLGYFDFAKQYLIYALAGLTGMELVAGKKLISFVFFLLLAFVVITTFFPDVAGNYLP